MGWVLVVMSQALVTMGRVMGDGPGAGGIGLDTGGRWSWLRWWWAGAGGDGVVWEGRRGHLHWLPVRIV